MKFSSWPKEQEALFERHPANPLADGPQLALRHQHDFQRRGDPPGRRHDAAVVPRGRPRGVSHLCAARSRDGVDGWTIDPEPTLLPNPDEYPEEKWGIEDPRITWLAELERYAVVYTNYSQAGPGVSLALTPRLPRPSSVMARFFRRKTRTPPCCRAPHRRLLGPDPPAGQSARRPHLDLLLARSAALGQPQADLPLPAAAPGGTPRRSAWPPRP